MAYRGVRSRCSCGCGLGDANPLALGLSAGVGLATGAVGLWMNSIQLSHQADTATSQIVNGLAPLLQANVDAYLKGPGTCADQAAAMGAYLTAIRWLYSPQGCGNGAYGSAGNRCISDRFGPGGPTDTTGAKFPWAAYYYWPIANDPRAADCVVDPEAAQAAAIANINAAVSGSPQTVTGGQLQGGGDLSSVVSGLGIPTWAVWAAAGLLVFAILK